MEPSARLGVDLGGSKIEAIIMSADGSTLERQRVTTPTDDYRRVLDAITDLCDLIEARAGLARRALPLGIGTPGSPSPADGLMRNCNSTALNGRALREDLEQHCGRAVRIANDADCFALSEALDGAAAGAESVFGVILGTGVGGGLVCAGRLLCGPNAVAGEWGHNRMPLERVTALPASLSRRPRACYCGRSDCVETWISGPGLAQTHRDLHGRELDAAALHAGRLDAALVATLDVYVEMLAAALAMVINILDPQVIVFGGGLSNLQRLHTRLPAALALQVFSDCLHTRLRAPEHGDSSGVRGAARLWS